MRLIDVMLRYPAVGDNFPAPDTKLTGICYDSRQVRPGNLFVAIPGTKVDGHDYVADALATGAIAAIVDRERLSALPSGLCYLAAPDPREALAWTSACFYGFPGRSLQLLGVTGTNGKTTTTHLLEAALQSHGQPSGLIGTLGARYIAGGLTTTVDLGFTTPQAPELQQLLAMMVDAGVRSVAMEVSSHALDQQRVAHLGFKAGIFTNLTRDHLDYHRTTEAYALAKAKLFSSLESTDFAILNADDPGLAQLSQAGPAQIFTYGLENNCDFTIKDIRLTATSSEGTLCTPTHEYCFRLPLPGRFNLYNALAAIATATALGLDLDNVLAALEHIPGIPGRIERVTPANYPFTVLVDYAHTPDGLENVLKTIRDFTTGRLICVFGCGGDRDRTKRPMMGDIASQWADVVCLTSDNPRSEDPQTIIADISAGIAGNYHAIVDRSEAINWAIRQAKPGDTIILAGKGHETYQLIAERKIAFDDREVARLVLRELAAG
ncbi:MAG: UDP-N-acetylmuramoyl-L-alanyl-D-glutamate--2,6-diaminopimelate ligase [Cyanobacteria bacterium NC_groundwater_1444_Ag_S-0.65um_54_12]|nr:UDP-N-acetylmuramoyl-L-alanyl-D-glutamate--2,6-diaminopimelate ligase [Cyanobacteria bacterium NC_groundwater_1444_Ag_S-0.65um_54_12]